MLKGDLIFMLTRRQINLFIEMSKKSGEYYKANFFSEKFNVSLRTIQNDIKILKDDSSSHSDAYVIESKVPFGTRIKIVNKKNLINTYLN